MRKMQAAPFSQFTTMSILLLKLIFVGLHFLPSITGDDHRFSYSGFSNVNLTLDGTASVTPGGLLELTNGSARSSGHAFYPTPLRFRESPNSTVRSFSAFFVFGIVSVFNDLSSHGLAFLVAPSTNFSDATPIGYLGLVNSQKDGNASNHIFAVELDTYMNSELQDMSGNHVGIDINGVISEQAHDAGFYHDQNGTFKDLSLTSQEAMQVWVEYDAEKAQISATMVPLHMVKPTRPTVSTSYNLSTVVTDAAYIGFSSATGKIEARHYVLGWSFGMGSPTAAPAINAATLPELPRRPLPKARSRVLQIAVPVATVVLLLAVGAVALLLARRHFRYAELREDWEVQYGPQRFSYKDLFRATEGFRNENLLGIGGFGRVYKGVLPGSKSQVVAVKRVSHDSDQGMKEFIAEVVSLGRLRHRNLVQLLGYCRRKRELLLVYDYIPNRSLDKYLYGSNNTSLSWSQRFHVIKGVASCLLYLHEEWEKVVLHRDIKASNVLLDDEMNGRLGDFGLARLYDHGVDPQTTNVVGTIGYLAPELARTGKATPLTDIFAFGIFVLEVACGQRPIKIDTTEDGQLVLLVDWVLQHSLKGSLADALDPMLKGEYNAEEACMALKLGLLCSNPLASARPSMRHVMQYLYGDIPPSELMPTHESFQVLASLQQEGFDSYIMACPSSTTSTGTISTIISIGR